MKLYSVSSVCQFSVEHLLLKVPSHAWLQDDQNLPQKNLPSKVACENSLRLRISLLNGAQRTLGTWARGTLFNVML